MVTGAGGFIGHHLVSYLKARGHWVRGVDIKHPQFEPTKADEFRILDLRSWEDCLEAAEDVDDVYALAADMGGMGFISSNHAQMRRNHALISLHPSEAAKVNGISRYLFSSSACAYSEHRQLDATVVPTREEDAFGKKTGSST